MDYGMGAQLVGTVIGGLMLAVASWLVMRTVRLPARVAALEQEMARRDELLDERYVRRVGTVDSPGFMHALSRIQAVEQAQSGHERRLDSARSERGDFDSRLRSVESRVANCERRHSD